MASPSEILCVGLVGVEAGRHRPSLVFESSGQLATLTTLLTILRLTFETAKTRAQCFCSVTTDCSAFDHTMIPKTWGDRPHVWATSRWFSVSVSFFTSDPSVSIFSAVGLSGSYGGQISPVILEDLLLFARMRYTRKFLLPS